MDGVILDFRGDDFSWKYNAVRDGIRTLGADPSGLDRNDLEAMLGGMGEEEFLKMTKELGVEPQRAWMEMADVTSEARAEMIQKGGFSLFPEVRECLRRLREMDKKIGVISNAPDGAVYRTVEAFDLKQLFHFYRGVESYEDFHHRKPHPDHLEMARAELKRDPFVYAGDHETDVEAARNATMDAVWVNRNSHSIETNPEYEVSSLDQLVEIASSDS